MPLPPVLYEDDTLIAFEKPSGMLIAPDRWDKSRENLMDLVHDKLGHHVANVHRIDADTSGVVLCTKTKLALDFVSGQFQSKSVGKIYHAITTAIPASDSYTVDLVIKEDEAKPGRMCVVKKHGKASTTHCTVLEKFPQPAGRTSFAYVECRPLTGRTHQIRIHLAATETPILNDPFYGTDAKLMLSDLKRGYKGRVDEKPLIARLALHAGSLTFKHPATRESVTITSPLPNDFEVALKYLRKFAEGKRR
ncbi:RluA family pseudouridine synthase [Oleiharenicola lentus]|uniref:RluA family pseudouridine synthase n=1 Tax=Oleiharenicola lentus TaxID=2508720 RepID=UPI003F66B95D